MSRGVWTQKSTKRCKFMFYLQNYSSFRFTLIVLFPYGPIAIGLGPSTNLQPKFGKILQYPEPDLDWGTVLSTNRKMAFSEGSWMRFLMIHMNWATVMSEGTRYFLLSMSTICDPDTFSTITWQTKQRHHRDDYNQHATYNETEILSIIFTHRDPVRVLVADFGWLHASMFCRTKFSICVIQMDVLQHNTNGSSSILLYIS